MRIDMNVLQLFMCTAKAWIQQVSFFGIFGIGNMHALVLNLPVALFQHNFQRWGFKFSF